VLKLLTFLEPSLLGAEHRNSVLTAHIAESSPPTPPASRWRVWRAPSDHPRLFILIEFFKDSLTIATVLLISKSLELVPQLSDRLRSGLVARFGVPSPPVADPSVSYLPFPMWRAFATILEFTTLLTFVVLLSSTFRKLVLEVTKTKPRQ
jgi:hypothetical protein